MMTKEKLLRWSAKSARLGRVSLFYGGLLMGGDLFMFFLIGILSLPYTL